MTEIPDLCGNSTALNAPGTHLFEAQTLCYQQWKVLEKASDTFMWLTLGAWIILFLHEFAAKKLERMTPDIIRRAALERADLSSTSTHWQTLEQAATLLTALQPYSYQFIQFLGFSMAVMRVVLWAYAGT